MHKSIIGAVLPVLFSLPVCAMPSCGLNACSVGQRVASRSSKLNFFYACPSAQLSDYTNTVAGLVFLRLKMGGRMPDQFVATGEPVYPDEIKERIDALRNRAGVVTFSQAVSDCRMGSNDRHLIVHELAADSDSIRVGRERGRAFWVPSGHLYPR